MGIYNKHTEVSCKDCGYVWLKRDDTLTAWGGLCRCCVQKHLKNLPEIRLRQSMRARQQVLRQGGIPNAKKFTSGPPELHPRWKGGKPKCVDCGKLLSEYKCVRCKSCAIKGGRHWNWQEGKSNEPYTAEWTQLLKESIRMRDGYNPCLM